MFSCSQMRLWVLPLVLLGSCRSQNSSPSPVASFKDRAAPLVTRIVLNQVESDKSGAAAASSGFGASTYPSSSFDPRQTVVIPLQAASYFAEAFAGQAFQTFSFVSTNCDEGAAFERFMQAFESLLGTSMPAEAREELDDALRQPLTQVGGPAGTQQVCAYYDLLACMGDYIKKNVDIVKGSVEDGDIDVFSKGALSCVAVAFGGE